jgi:import receptor subunit TOM22
MQTLMERILALADVVPPETRVKLSNAASQAWDLSTSAASYLGKGAWILATASFMLLLPVAFESEKEQAALMQEAAMRMQQEM